MDRFVDIAAASRALHPLQQGELDGFCGMYSVINAIRLALWPEQILSEKQHEALFAAGVAKLSDLAFLAFVCREGMMIEVLLEVAHEICLEASTLTNIRFLPEHLDHLTDIASVLSIIDTSLRQGAPVIVGLEGTHDHWTVVSKITRHRVAVFDSSGLKWIGKTSIAFGETAGHRRHLISKDSIWRLRREGSSPAGEKSDPGAPRD